jgi:hypothetical protein
LLNGRDLEAFKARSQPSTARDISAPSRGNSLPSATAARTAACAETASATLSSLGIGNVVGAEGERKHHASRLNLSPAQKKVMMNLTNQRLVENLKETQERTALSIGKIGLDHMDSRRPAYLTPAIVAVMRARTRN